MDKKNMFMVDVEIPEVVTHKATEAFSTIKAERNKKMRAEENRGSSKTKIVKMAKRITAVAACAALLVVATTAGSTLRQNNEKNTTADSDLFTLRVMAAELDADSPQAYLSKEAGYDWAICETEEGGITYAIGVPLTCEGENIDSVTYSINQGAFQIVHPADSSIVLNGTAYEGELNVPITGGEENTNGDLGSSIDYYSSYTVDYDTQTSDTTWINICDNKPMAEADQNLLFNNENLEDNAAFFNKLFKGVTITCTVNLTDGTTQSETINMHGQVLTFEEANIPAENPSRQSAFVMFELKE